MFFNREREAFPLSDAQMKEACLQAVKEHCNSIRKTGKFDENRCLEIAKAEFNRQYRQARGYKRRLDLKEEDVLEMNSIFSRLWLDIAAETRKIAISYGSTYKAKQITKVTAESIIRTALSKAGLRDNVIVCQCYRAKVTVTMPSKYKIMFIIRYRDIMEGKLDSMMEQFLSFAGTVETLPFQVKIWK